MIAGQQKVGLAANHVEENKVRRVCTESRKPRLHHRGFCYAWAVRAQHYFAAGTKFSSNHSSGRLLESGETTMKLRPSALTCIAGYVW